ncbi:MAG: amidohydrolase family protein [Pseudomonadota bacterium]
MKIVDAHHHIWNPWTNPHPWLKPGAEIAFRYGGYEALKRPFLWADYDKLADGLQIVASVTMEGEWALNDPLGEARWLQGIAASEGRPAAHAAQAWLDRDDCADVLGALEKVALVRSVRHKPRANIAPGGPPGGMADTAFAAGFRALAQHHLMFELQTPWWHLAEACQLAETAPEVPIILNHTGLPADRSPDGLTAWREAMIEFSKVPLAFVKISGLGLAGGGWDAVTNRQIIRQTIEIFGPDRCMFASNYPVDGLCVSFVELWHSFADATADLGQSERDALFHGTATSVYGLAWENAP